jgi:hypothetical protein
MYKAGDFIIDIPDKECKACGLVKSITEFKARCYAKKTFDSMCRKCRNVRNGELRNHLANRDQSTRWRAELARTNPAKLLWFRAKTRAIQNGTEFTISPDDITITKHCPVLGIELTFEFSNSGLGRRVYRDNVASLDRIDSSKGYIPGNVCVISRKANTIKNCGTAEEHERIARYIRSYGVK